MGFEDYYDEGDYYDRPSFHSNKEHVELAFSSVIKETPKAWYIRFPMKKDLTNDDVWLPKSQCEMEDGADRIWVPRWLVTEKELEDYET